MTTLHEVELGGATIEYSLRRSRRRKKTVQICVSGGRVEVAAPLRTPNREIRDIVLKRSGWILSKLKNDSQASPPLRLVTGDTLPYLGQDLPLVVRESNVRRPSARLDGSGLLAVVPPGMPEG